MSNIDNRHNVVPFVSGKSVAFKDQRLAKVGYKSTTKNKAKFPSICVSIPPVSDNMVTENVEKLIPYIRMMIEETQDKVIRGLYEGKGGNLSSISDEEIGVDACIGYLEMETTGGRLTKEAVTDWFEENLADTLTVVLAEKLGFTGDTLTEGQTKEIGKYLAGYREVIGSLSGGKTFLQPAQIQGVRKAIGYVDPEDDIAKKLTARLNNMEKKPELAELLDI